MEGSGRHCSPPDAPAQVDDCRTSTSRAGAYRDQARPIMDCRRTPHGAYGMGSETGGRRRPAASPPPGRGRRSGGSSLIMTAPGRLRAHPAAPWGRRLRRRSVRATRNPLLFRLPVVFLLRFAERRFLALLFQEPPRSTRRQGDGQAPGTGRTTRPERWHGAGAECSHGRRGRPTHPPAARPPRAPPGPRASAHASPAGGCGSGARSLPVHGPPESPCNHVTNRCPDPLPVEFWPKRPGACSSPVRPIRSGGRFAEYARLSAAIGRPQGRTGIRFRSGQ